MTLLVIIILALTIVALYPLIREFLRRRKTSVPAYVEALQLILDGRATEAIPRLKETVGSDPDNIDAWVRLGDIYMEQGETERALKIHENLNLRRNLKPGDERLVFRALARDYLKTGRKLKAIATLEELMHDRKRERSTATSLFRLYVKTESWDKCESLLHELGRNSRDRPWIAALMAEYGRAVATANPEAAAKQFTEALRFDPGSIAVRLYRGDYHRAQGDTEAAVRDWQELLELAPEQNRLVRGRLERAFYDLGRYDETTKLYEDILRKTPQDAGLAVALAMILRKKQSLGPAVSLLERACAGRKDLLCSVTLAALELEAGHHDKAGRVLESVIGQLQAEELACPHCGKALAEPVLSCPSCGADLSRGESAPGRE